MTGITIGWSDCMRRVLWGCRGGVCICTQMHTCVCACIDRFSTHAIKMQWPIGCVRINNRPAAHALAHADAPHGVRMIKKKYTHTTLFEKRDRRICMRSVFYFAGRSRFLNTMLERRIAPLCRPPVSLRPRLKYSITVRSYWFHSYDCLG